MSDEEITVEECRLYARAWIFDLLEGDLADEDLLVIWNLLQYIYSSDT